MAESVEFILKLQDQMTASLKAGADNALKLEQVLGKTVDKLASLEKEEQKEKEAEGGMFETAIVKGELIKDVIEKVAEKVFELGKELVASAVEVSDFGFRAEVALRHLNGETEESHVRTTKMLQGARDLAFEAGVPVEQITKAFLGLRTAGVSDSLTTQLTEAAGDLASLKLQPEQFTQLTDVFENVALKGQLTGQALRGLANAGVSPAAIAARVGAKDFKDLQHQLEQKPIGAIEGFKIIEDLIKKTAHEKNIGDVFKEQSGTIGGSVQKIKDVWENLLDDVLNKKDSAFGTLRSDFEGLAINLKKNLPQLEAAFTKTFDPIIKAVDKFISDPEAISQVFETAVGSIKLAAAAIAPLVEAMQWLTKHESVAKAAAEIGGGAVIGSKFGGTPGAVAGAAIGGLGTVFGEKTKSEEKYEKDTFGAASGGELPYIGSHATGGPIDQEGMAHLHEGEYVVPAGGALVRGSGGGGGGSVHAPVTVNVHVEGGHGMTEQGLKIMLEEMLPGALVSPFEKLASSVGAM